MNQIKEGTMCLYKGNSLAMVNHQMPDGRIMITVLSEDHDTCYEKIAEISEIEIKR